MVAEKPQMSTVLMTLKKPVVENAVCVAGYRKVCQISGEQMCVGGHVGQDSCAGDSGGPLMKVQDQGSDGPRYYVLAVVSFGPKNCGKTNTPGVYTRVSFYMPWILNNIKK